jgi:hypothetical protein
MAEFPAAGTYPDGSWDQMDMLAKSTALRPSAQGELVDFKGKVAVVTGAGNGYANVLASSRNLSFFTAD